MLVKKAIAYLSWLGRGCLGEEVQLEAHRRAFPECSFELYYAPRYQKADAACISDTFINMHTGHLASCNQLTSRMPMFTLGGGVGHPDFWTHYDGRPNQLPEWKVPLERFIFRGVRGPVSKRLLDSIDVQSEIVGDASLYFLDDKPLKPKAKIIGISIGSTLNKCYGRDDGAIIRAFKTICQELHKRGWKTHLVPSWPGDTEVIIAHFSGAPNTAMDYVLSADMKKLRRMFGQYQAFLGFRAHPSILASVFGVPVYAIDYQNKCRDFLESIGRGDWVQRSDRIDVGKVIMMLERLAEERATIQAQNYEAISRLRTRWLKAVDTIKEHIL